MRTDDVPRVLCVDDDATLRDAITRVTRRRFDVTTAGCAAAGLEALGREGPFAVVISDLRMPGMDGVAFLARVREAAPDTVRVLLTGQADLAAAIAAVNEGHIFRFLEKPCLSEAFIKALSAAAEQHRLITAERVLLEQTLGGSIKALTHVLALVNPMAFGRATRVKGYVSELAERLAVPDRWQVEVAALLSQIGCVTLPQATVEKVYYGRTLSQDEQAMVAALPVLADSLLTSIPRLEPVRRILLDQNRRFGGVVAPGLAADGAAFPWGARALKIALDFDALEAQDLSPSDALDTMRGREGWYDPELLAAFGALRGAARQRVQIRELRLRDVELGMVFVEDVKTETGTLLIARGSAVTQSLQERLRNTTQGMGAMDPVRVFVPGDSAPQETPAPPHRGLLRLVKPSGAAGDGR